jgi:hypothetical protein
VYCLYRWTHCRLPTLTRCDGVMHRLLLLLVRHFASVLIQQGALLLLLVVVVMVVVWTRDADCHACLGASMWHAEHPMGCCCWWQSCWDVVS